MMSSLPSRPDIDRLCASFGKHGGGTVLDTLIPLRLGANKLRAILQNSLDLTRRYTITLATLWKEPALEDTLQHPNLSPLDRYKRLSRQLEAWKTNGHPRWQNESLLCKREKTQSRMPTPEDLLPKQIYVDPAVLHAPSTQDILTRFPQIRAEITAEFDVRTRSLPLTQGKRTWVLTAHKGRTLKLCPGLNDRYLCCNYWTFDLVSHCPLECSYCILQSYLKDKPVIHIYTNVDQILEELGRAIDADPDRPFRIGTGELADSLALDPLLRFNEKLILFFAQKKNAILELKTKSNYVDHLLDLPHRGRTVIAWSINLPELILSEEWRTASFDERLDAAMRCIAHGYKVAFHIDPIVIDLFDEEACVARYEAMIARLKAEIPAASIAWMSLGTLRYPKDLKEIAEARLAKTKIYTHITDREGEKRYYPEQSRLRILKRLWSALDPYLPTERRYLCMENKRVWHEIDPTAISNSSVEERLMRSFEELSFTVTPPNPLLSQEGENSRVA